MKLSDIRTLKEQCIDLFSQPNWREVLEEGQVSSDFEVDNVRFISSDCIDEIWTNSLIEMIKDCYDLSDVPSFVAIDWEHTATNCKVDGLGHHFNSYDGSEEEITIDGTLYHVFDNH
jgi:hypothetical protein